VDLKFLANHRSSNQIAPMEKENLKLTNTISSLITDDLKKNTKHESFEHAAQIWRNVIKLYVSDIIKTDRLAMICQKW
jgi:protein-arginine kinase activator protein McsA